MGAIGVELFHQCGFQRCLYPSQRMLAYLLGHRLGQRGLKRRQPDPLHLGFDLGDPRHTSSFQQYLRQLSSERVSRERVDTPKPRNLCQKPLQ